MANELMVEGQLYDWLMDNGYTSEENAHILAGLTQRSGIVVPNEMKREGRLLNFFKDRSNIFGIVRGTDEAQNPSIYARDFRQGYRGRPARGRGGLQTYVNRRDAQAAADARLSRLREYVADSAASEQSEIYRNTPGNPSYNWNQLVGGKYSKSKSKSKSRSRSARKSRGRKNRNRRSKSKSRN